MKVVPFFNSPEAMMNDDDYREMLVNWIRIGKCTSMHVERLLSRYKRSIFHQGPHAERVSAAGLLSEWCHEHIAGGGRNPKITVAKHLVEDFNAPLRMAGRCGLAQPKKARGNFLYASEKWQEHQKQNGTTRFTQQDYYAFRAKFCKDFTTDLSEEMQKLYNSRSITPGHGMNPLDSVHEMPARRGYNLDGELLFGLSTEKSPLSEDCASELLKEMLGVSQVGGFSSYDERIRKLFVDKLFVKDGGAIPSNWKNTSIQESQCSELHPGLCKHRDGDIYHSVLEITKQLRKFIKTTGGVARGNFIPIIEWM